MYLPILNRTLIHRQKRIQNSSLTTNKNEENVSFNTKFVACSEKVISRAYQWIIVVSDRWQKMSMGTVSIYTKNPQLKNRNGSFVYQFQLSQNYNCCGNANIQFPICYFSQFIHLPNRKKHNKLNRKNFFWIKK